MGTSVKYLVNQNHPPSGVTPGESEEGMRKEYDVLKKKLEEKERQYNTTFGASLIFSTSGTVSVGDFDKNREITLEELKELISKYSQLDALVENLTEETSIKF